MNIRVDEETKEFIKLLAVREGVSQNTLVTTWIKKEIASERRALEPIKEAIVRSRAAHRRSAEEVLALAKKAAHLDTSEGIGERKVFRTRTKK
jgi:hypothetical protein